MIIEVVLKSDKTSSGRISELGAAGKYGYSEGEEILRLEADDFGKWVGQLKWRSVAGVQRWDPITFVATAEKLNATMTTDACYKDMPRVHGTGASQVRSDLRETGAWASRRFQGTRRVP